MLPEVNDYFFIILENQCSGLIESNEAGNNRTEFTI